MVVHDQYKFSEYGPSREYQTYRRNWAGEIEYDR